MSTNHKYEQRDKNDEELVMLRNDLAELDFKCWAESGKHMDPPNLDSALENLNEEEKEKRQKEIVIKYCNPTGTMKYHDFIEHRKLHY